MDFSKIKLIIWDLDETFWQGTLSEEKPCPNEDNIQLVRMLNDRGIINSICSKNDFDTARTYLQSLDNVWDEFVFPSISWLPKGEAVKQQIADMGLRECNVLFLDDNVSNRNEVVYYCPDIMTEHPDIIPELRSWVESKEASDKQRKRVGQYKILEQKREARSKVPSNEDFLMDSDIRVSVFHDCEKEIDRLHEIIMRTNQLNYTKNRMPKDELEKLLREADVKSGYVSATDKYGDYGIVGFYACKNDELVHFAFSCRTMGMGLEQYIYNLLGKPKLDVVGEVAYVIEEGKATPWIKSAEQAANDHSDDNIGTSGRFLIKGPCDMDQLLVYIKGDMFDAEFAFVNEDNGVFIEAHNTTTHMVQAFTLSDDEKKRVIDECPFSSSKYFDGNFLSSEYNAVFFSTLSDPNLGLYRRKESGELVAFGEHVYDLTDEKNLDKYISGEIFTSNCKFTRESISAFAEKYEYLGQITPEKMLENIDKIRKTMPQSTTLVLMLGSELEYLKNTSPAASDRHVFHQKINNLLREYAKDKANVRILDYGKYVVSQDQYYDNINHFIKPVYYMMAQDVISIVRELAPDVKLRRKDFLRMLKAYLGQIKRKIFSRE